MDGCCVYRWGGSYIYMHKGLWELMGVNKCMGGYKWMSECVNERMSVDDI